MLIFHILLPSRNDWQFGVAFQGSKRQPCRDLGLKDKSHGHVSWPKWVWQHGIMSKNFVTLHLCLTWPREQRIREGLK